MATIHKENLEKDAKIILKLIPEGRVNAITMKELMYLTGLYRRRITDVIRHLRKTHLVCSTKCPGGYWIGTKDEAIMLIKELNCTANTTYETARNLRRVVEGVVDTFEE